MGRRMGRRRGSRTTQAGKDISRCRQWQADTEDEEEAMTAGYKCDVCRWLGGEPTPRRALEKVDDGPAFAVVIESCPDCGNDDLDDCLLCVLCQRDGIEVEATHDDYCATHAAQNFDAEDMELFRRDAVQPVRALVKP
jgi:hypothetical protein